MEDWLEPGGNPFGPSAKQTYRHLPELGPDECQEEKLGMCITLWVWYGKDQEQHPAPAVKYTVGVISIDRARKTAACL